MENDNAKPKTPLNDNIKHRFYLAVPFAEKSSASSKGARYDSSSKSWYIDMRQHDKTAFVKWSVKPHDLGAHGMGQATPMEDFKLFLAEHGVSFPAGTAPIMDGAKHYAKLEETKGAKKNVTYCAFDDESPAGYISDHKNGTYSKWTFKAPSRPIEEQRAIKANAYVRSLIAADVISKNFEAVSKESTEFFKALPLATNHPYLTTKNLESGFVARQTTDGYLVLPVQDVDGKIWSLQTISERGKKFIKKDSKKQSNLIAVSGNVKSAKMIIVTEGWADAESISQSIRIPVVAAIDANNLDPVVREIQRVNPGAKILLAGDNDYTTELDARGRVKPNVGVEKATIAASRAGIPAVYPLLPGEPQKVDFNDMFRELGSTAVHQHISKHTKEFIVPRVNNAQEEVAQRTKPKVKSKTSQKGHTQG